MSLLPAAIDGLVALVKRAAASTPTQWQIVDGVPAATTKPGLVCVAYTGTAGEVAVTEIVDPSSSANMRRTPKTYEIMSQVSHYAGNGGIRARRETVYALVDAIEAQLRSDPTLGGAFQGTSWWAGSRYAPVDQGGPEVVVEFTVRVQGFEV